MGSPGSTGELELVPVATSAPSIAVLYRAELVPMVRRLVLIGSPLDLAESIAHRAFARIASRWDQLEDPVSAVRRTALEDVLARFRPAGRAPTRTPPRHGAPPEWAAVAPLLDPLAPLDRAAAVLRTYDGLGPVEVDALLGRRRRAARSAAPPVDRATAELFAASVADVAPASRLTELLGYHLGDDLDGVSSRARVPHQRRWHGVGAAVVALALVGAFGGRFDVDLGVPTAHADQELRTGATVDGGAASGATTHSDLSSCRSADPVLGPGGTPLPAEGDTEPGRVAQVLATDRRAIVSLHRGGLDARVIERSGRVRRTGLNGAGRVRNIDGGDDVQLQVVIESTEFCPDRPQAWKGVPIVFTSAARAAGQAPVLVSGAFADGVAWEVQDRPGLGLCARLGNVETPCTSQLEGEDRYQDVRLMRDGAGWPLVWGYLPAGATVARVELDGGELGPPSVQPGNATFFALATDAATHAIRIRFFNERGAAVASMPFPAS